MKKTSALVVAYALNRSCDRVIKEIILPLFNPVMIALNLVMSALLVWIFPFLLLYPLELVFCVFMAMASVKLYRAPRGAGS